MRFNVEQNELVKAIERLRLAKTDEWIATMGAHEEGVIVLVSQNHVMSVSAIVPVSCMLNAAEHPVTLPLAALSRWVKNVSGEVNVEVDDNKVTFSVASATLPLFFVPDRLIVMPPLDAEPVEVGAEVWDAVKRVEWCASTDDSRPQLTCVVLDDGAVWATDSYRAALVELPGFDIQTTIPPTLGSVFKVIDADEFTSVTLDERSGLHLTDKGGRVVLSTVAAQPPTTKAIRGFVDRSNAMSELTLHRKDTLDALKHLKDVQGKQHQIVFVTESELRVRTDDELIATHAFQPIDRVGDVPDFAANLAFLIEALESFREDEVTLHVFGAVKPITMVEGDYRTCLMPVRATIEGPA